ncbi:MAG: sensor histidine kinase [Anaerolineales bacterium]|jgi:NarL family two-component system sensor histidine kinase YdfH
MKTDSSVLSQIRNLFSGSPPARDDELGYERVFMVVVTVVLLGLYALTLYNSPSFRTSGRVALFTGLMALHILLYWAIFYFPLNQRWGIGYLILQSVIAFSITWLTQNLTMVFGLYPPLIGLAVGILRPLWFAALGIVFLLGVGAVSTILMQGWNTLLSWAWVAIPVALFVVVYVTLYGRQADARVQAQKLLGELEEAHLQLVEYAAQIEDLTLVAERQRMARELHDTLAQGLAGLILQLEACSTHLEQGRTARAQEIIHQAMGRARATLADARRAIRDLREAPEGAKDFGKVLRREIERFSAATGIPCDLRLELPDPIPEPVGVHAQRIVAEGLANVAQHAQANQAWLHAASDGNQLDLEIRDDGVGFDPSIRSPGDHYGLVGMRERARLAGGSIEITSQVGQGTNLKVTLPLMIETLSDTKDRRMMSPPSDG